MTATFDSSPTGLKCARYNRHKNSQQLNDVSVIHNLLEEGSGTLSRRLTDLGFSWRSLGIGERYSTRDLTLSVPTTSNLTRPPPLNENCNKSNWGTESPKTMSFGARIYWTGTTTEHNDGHVNEIRPEGSINVAHDRELTSLCQQAWTPPYSIRRQAGPVGRRSERSNRYLAFEPKRMRLTRWHAARSGMSHMKNLGKRGRMI